MIPTEVFDVFAQGDDSPRMAQPAMENALSPRWLDRRCEDTAQRQCTRDLLCSSLVGLMSLVVCRIRPSINAAYPKRAVPVGVSLKAVDGKIARIETSVGAALVRLTAQRLAPVITAMRGGRAPYLEGYRTRILDGNHLPGSEHRIKALRTLRAGALPGHTLVVLDPDLMLVVDAIPCEDGHAQERSLLDPVEATVRPGALWIADRNFCTTGFVFGVHRRGGCCVIRQHASTLQDTLVGKRRARGRSATGAVFEPTLRATNAADAVVFLRRGTVVLDQPTRDGDTEIHRLTNLPVKHARAKVVAELYRRRWTIETAFQAMEETLHGESHALGYPTAALFSCCMALGAYNVMSTVKAALRSAPGEAEVETLAGDHLAEAIQLCHRGMMKAIPKDEWMDFQEMSPSEWGEVLVVGARATSLAGDAKSTRGPKQPKPAKERGAKIKHVATSRILESRTTCTT